MDAKDILPGRCYEAKRPSMSSGFYFNDRQVKWVSSDLSQVQYDSPSVANGRRYPTVPMEKFLKWVGRDVTAIMPEGDWRPFRGRWHKGSTDSANNGTSAP